MKNFLKKTKFIGLFRKTRDIIYYIQNCYLTLIYPSGRFIRSNGAEIFVNFKDPNFRWYFGSNLFLQQEHEAFVRLLDAKDPSVIVDIGAHWGIFPAMLDADAKFAKKIKRVICIEPDPKNIPQLKNTISRIKNFPVSIIEAAIGDCDSEIPAYRGGGACLQTYNSDQNESELTVPVMTLKTILCSLDLSPADISHIKIDIDGYEPAFFVGNASFFKQTNPFIMTEYWSKGLIANKKYPIKDYWQVLVKNYLIIICNYPAGDYTLLGENDFNKINDITKNLVVNLLLIPKIYNFDLRRLGLS